MPNISAQMMDQFLEGNRNLNASLISFGNLAAHGTARGVAIDTPAAAPVAGHSALIENVATSAADTTFNEYGHAVTTGSTQYNSKMITPLVGLAATPNPFCSGVGTGATARNDNNSAFTNLFKTAASTSDDIGRGIGFIASIYLPSVAGIEVMIGFGGDKPQDLYMGASTTVSNTIPTDGFYFFFNSSSYDYWQCGSNAGSTVVDTLHDSGIAPEAGKLITLRAELDTEGRPDYWINNHHVKQGTAVDAATTLGFMAGVKTLVASTAKTLNLIHFEPYVARPAEAQF